ncbi:C-C motif chemokine 8-like [Astyanax mexicanus]|uniref:C-C motif chemokine n=1 Tax=Astyanax mexicanus TaxID=7994 RepID=A0A8B9JC01_ASTMX|nr:C-C motif chemokine 8-like [Astyanax mexicanus]
MKFWSGSLLLGLLVVLCLQSCVEGQHMNEPSVCCFSFYKGRIPLQRIMKYETTRSDCTKPGVVFTVWSGKRVCVEPADDWVKQTMDQIDKRALDS